MALTKLDGDYGSQTQSLWVF